MKFDAASGKILCPACGSSFFVDEMENELESRRDMIKGKIAAAKTQERINKMTSSVNGANNSMAAFDRMEAKANAMLDKANAMSALNAGTGNEIEDLTKKYGSSSVNVDAELEALKASLGQTTP